MTTNRKTAFTITEVLTALIILMMALGILAEASGWHAKERDQSRQQEQALEIATNVQEQAKATPFADLTPDWAKQQSLPKHVTLPGADLRVTVDEERPGLKRVTAQVNWEGGGKRERSFTLTRWAAPRSTKEIRP